MSKFKTEWSWAEWLSSRAARRATSRRVGPVSTRRRESASDTRLRNAFDGKRGPDFT